MPRKSKASVPSCPVKPDNSVTGICNSRVSGSRGKPVGSEDQCRHGHAWDYRAEQWRAATRCGECSSYKSGETKTKQI